MFQEIFEYLTTKATPMAKQFGFLYNSIALKKRYKRCRSAWTPHLEHCHHFILSNIDDSMKHIAIVGSGHLLEVPIEKLLAKNINITLIDIHHPKNVNFLAQKHPLQIQILSIDVTGFAQFSQKKFTPNLDNFLNFSPPIITEISDRQFDLIISANILSQLAINFLSYIQNKNKIFNLDEYINIFVKKLCLDHFQFLNKYGKKHILFTDIIRNYYDANRNLIESIDSLVHVPSDIKLQQSWDWKISPFGEQSHEYEMEMKVNGYIS